MLNPKDIKPHQEQYEYFTTKTISRRRFKRCQYDYRAHNGELFSCVRPTLADCVAARDAWLLEKGWEA